jgi:hypothetical protein
LVLGFGGRLGEAGRLGLGLDGSGLRIRGCGGGVLVAGAVNRAARPGPVGLTVAGLAGMASGLAAGALWCGFSAPSAALRDWGLTAGA